MKPRGSVASSDFSLRGALSPGAGGPVRGEVRVPAGARWPHTGPGPGAQADRGLHVLSLGRLQACLGPGSQQPTAVGALQAPGSGPRWALGSGACVRAHPRGPCPRGPCPRGLCPCTCTQPPASVWWERRVQLRRFLNLGSSEAASSSWTKRQRTATHRVALTVSRGLGREARPGVVTAPCRGRLAVLRPPHGL